MGPYSSRRTHKAECLGSPPCYLWIYISQSILFTKKFLMEEGRKKAEAQEAEDNLMKEMSFIFLLPQGTDQGRMRNNP